MLASLPAMAIIGVVLGATGLGLTFRATARGWLAGQPPVQTAA